jgi:hypothetical protein
MKLPFRNILVSRSHLPLAALALVGIAALAACTSESKRLERAAKTAVLRLPEGKDVETYRIPAAAREPELVYATYSRTPEGEPRVDRISVKTWQGEEDFWSGASKQPKRFTPGLRYQYLWNAYMANSRNRSNSGLRHVACFTGDAALFFSRFLAPGNDIAYLDGFVPVTGSISSDGYLIGLEGVFNPPNQAAVPFHFRLPSCFTPGKADLMDLVTASSLSASRGPSSESPVVVPLSDAEKSSLRALVRGPASIVDRTPQAVSATGFQMLDQPTDPAAASLPRFKLSADYEQADSRWSDAADRPWKGMSVESAEGQKKLAQLLLDYAYEGMVTGAASPDAILYPERNTKRYWCNMPWLNVGESGREAIHGLTRERALGASPMYPSATFGSDWGVGFYNGQGCRGIASVFGTRSSPKASPQYRRSAWGGDLAYFPDASVAVKFLFTTADFPALKGTHVMKANVTHERGETKRRIQPVRLVQIDIAVRDSSIRGARKELDYWVMTTYYYDPSYRSPSAVAGIPEGFRHMRPQGIQLGLGKPPKDSVTFPGSLANGIEGRLNGPADNPKGSCLGCHATAGTAVPMVPGLLNDADYAAQRAQALDFSQQLALARRNEETKSRGNGE